VGQAGRDLIAPMVEQAWPGYGVRFPRYRRDLSTSYYTITSARFDAVVRAALPPEAVLTRARVLAAGTGAVTLADGTRVECGAVIDARGMRHHGHLTGGWQKFVGQRLRLAHPHGLARPIVMDAGVEQIDGFRFVYCLPLSPDEIFIEDTYYSDSPTIDQPALALRIAAYARAQGWMIEAVLDEERGVLPVVAGETGRASGGRAAAMARGRARARGCSIRSPATACPRPCARPWPSPGRTTSRTRLLPISLETGPSSTGARGALRARSRPCCSSPRRRWTAIGCSNISMGSTAG
jgi:lycopene beta-cyclase